MTNQTVPPGAPGIPPRWTSSAKSAVGAAAGAESKVWFTISLSRKLDLATGDGRALLAMGFGSKPEEAAFRAILSLQQGAALALKKYSAGWRNLQSTLLPLDEPHDPGKLTRYRISTVGVASRRCIGSNYR